MNRCVIIALLSLVAGCGTQSAIVEPSTGHELPDPASKMVPDYVEEACPYRTPSQILAVAEVVDAARQAGVSKQHAIQEAGAACQNTLGADSPSTINCFSCYVVIAGWVYR